MRRHDAASRAKRLAHQFLAYASIGLVGTIVHYATLAALVELVGLVSVSASAMGYVTGALVNYVLNHRFTFRSKAVHTVAMPKFMTVAAIGLCLNTLLMMMGTQWLALHYLIVQVLATMTVLCWGYAANALWTFKWKAHGHD